MDNLDHIPLATLGKPDPDNPLSRTVKCANDGDVMAWSIRPHGVSIGRETPTLKYKGKSIVHFSASTKHLALYGTDTEFEEAHKEELAPFDLSGRGTIRFTPDNPLPPNLVVQFLQEQIDRINAEAAK